MELNGAAHQFLDERGADFVGPLDDFRDDLIGEFDAEGIESDEFGAAFGVRVREFDGLVNASRTSREGGFQGFRAIGGKDEQDFGVFFKAVHFIEKFIQEDFLATGVHLLPVAGDEVRILDYDDAMLQEPGERHVLAEQPHLFGSDEQSGVMFQSFCQIVNRVGFACSGRAVEQDSLFRRLAVLSQPGAITDEADDVAFEQFQRRGGEDDLLFFDGPQFVNLNPGGFSGIRVLGHFEGENLSAVGLRFEDRFFEMSEEFLRNPCSIGIIDGSDFELDAGHLTVMASPAEEDDVFAGSLFQEPEAVFQASNRLLISDIEFFVLRRNGKDRIVMIVGDDAIRE